MADVYVNALTTISTEPTTTDSLVAVNRNTNEGKIIDYNLLADAILNKLTSKTYSGLNTTSKLLVGAINELDGDVSSLNSRFSSNVSMQTYTVPTAGRTFTLSANYRGIIFLLTSTAASCGLLMIFSTGSGVIAYKSISEASNVTIDVSTAYKVTITPTSGSRDVLFLTTSGSVS